MSLANDPNRVIVFDTTLRDGEQSPGCSMNPQEKLEIAFALRDLGVDVIEAGFPIASPGDFESVKTIAQRVEGPIIAGLARCHPADIDRAAEAVKFAARPRVHVFLATSAIHREFKLKMSREEILRRTVEGVKRARDLVEDVEFSPEDASRTELDFLAEVVEKAIEAGATTLNIPDTVGYAVPSHYARIIQHLKTHVRGADKVIFSVHCHNDLGLAVANSLAALEVGARQVECTINGIGERAGNTALEEIVMAMHTRKDQFHLTTNINTRNIVPISRKLAHITGMVVQRNKAIVGANAFAHESGVHQDGMLKNPSTYEIMKPEDIGLPSGELKLGKLSGRAALKDKVEKLGYHLTDEQLQAAFEAFKNLADRKKEIYDADLEAIAENLLQSTVQKKYTLHAFTCNAGTGTLPSAAVCLWQSDGQLLKDAAVGDGPVDAVFQTINRICNTPTMKLIDYRIRAVTVNADAQGEAYVEVIYQGQKMHARAVSTDIVEASALAYLDIINRMVTREFRAKQNPKDAPNFTGDVTMTPAPVKPA
ncbi:MAG: 2-isopropylmalate synthase [Fimbriiglobus sp.]